MTDAQNRQERITMAHGAGGRQTSALISDIFRKYFDNPHLTKDDAAVLGRPDGRIAVTTDGFIVSPPFFPGGNVGKLSVCGTVNDLACMGARPLYLTCAFILEEGFPVRDLEAVASSMAEAAREAGAVLVAGDTKVAGRGQADGVFITTTGIGVLDESFAPAGHLARPGDKVIVTGDIGRHGATILLARSPELGIRADVESDCAPLWHTVEAMRSAAPGIHVIRDATRGGVGTVLYEIASESGVGVRLDQTAVPVSDPVRGVTGLLGLDPLYLANEGTMVVICPPDQADGLVEALRTLPHSENAAVIGDVTSDHPEIVTVRTEIGSETILPLPTGELLPRIC